MESKWRQNVVDLGFVGDGTTLCARLVTPIGPYTYVRRATLEGWPALISFPVELTDGRLLWSSVAIPVEGNFPFGLAVEPDSM